MRARYVTGVFLVATLLPALAHAFVCSRVRRGGAETGPALTWGERQVVYTFHVAGTADIAGELEFDIVRDSFTEWEDVLGCCTGTRGVIACAAATNSNLEFVESATRSSVNRVGYDFLAPEQNENLIVFQDDEWLRDPFIIGLTTTTYVPLTGRLLDADIEFNTQVFRFSADANVQNCAVDPVDCDCPQGPTPGCAPAPMDLKNVAVHEIGHFLGLGHTPVSLATMAPEGGTRETNKRDLDCDDRDGIVFKYPQDAANGYCTPVADCGRCAPPDELTATLNVTVRDHHDGEGCDCKSSSPDALALALGLGTFLVRCRRARTSA